jgi:hypothetical protein
MCKEIGMKGMIVIRAQTFGSSTIQLYSIFFFNYRLELASLWGMFIASTWGISARSGITGMQVMSSCFVN